MMSISRRGLLEWDKATIPREEYERRVESVRNVMGKEGLDALLIYSSMQRTGNVCYLTHYLAPMAGFGALAILPIRGPVSLLVERGPRDLPFVKTLTWVEDVRSSADADMRVSYANETHKILEGLKLTDGKIGLVGVETTMSVPIYQEFKQLFSALPRTKFTDATDFYETMRVTKTQAEINAIRKSANVADSAYAALAKNAQKGRKEFEVAAHIDRAARLGGAEDFSLLFATGSYAEKALRPVGDVEIEEGSFIMSRFLALTSRYWAEVGRTAIVGSAPKEKERLLKATRGAFEKAVEIMKPGVAVSRVAKEAIQQARAAGYGDYVKHEYGFGHGIGLEQNEKPFITEQNDAALKSGMVIAVCLGVHKPKVGGAFFSDTFLIKDGGFERLSKTDYEVRIG